jgi:hypothetical protein
MNMFGQYSAAIQGINLNQSTDRLQTTSWQLQQQKPDLIRINDIAPRQRIQYRLELKNRRQEAALCNT